MSAATAFMPPAHGGARLEFVPARAPGGLGCWLAVPRQPDPGAPLLVAVHGIRRGAEEQAELFAARAAALGRTVVAPLFDATHWSGYQRLGGARPADMALTELLQTLRDDGLDAPARFDLFGFSAGAQFAHRYAMLHPEHIARLSVAAAGWYTFPDAAAFPYGLATPAGRTDGRGRAMQAALGRFLRLPIRVHVGALDNRRDPNTRRGVAIDRQQGLHRRERAARWVEALQLAAAVRGIRADVRLSVLHDVGHDFRACMQHAGLADRVLGPAAPTEPALRIAMPPSGWTHHGAPVGAPPRRTVEAVLCA